MQIRRSSFTIVEILFVISVIAIIVNMAMPAFNESREKARFVRWLGFNKQCSSDPACVINFNFQDGKGSVLTNSAAGSENVKFMAKDYYGIVKGSNLVTKNGTWVKGRWWKGKRALQFDGTTVVEIPKFEAINFGEDDDYTIIVWVKFDKLDQWATPFSKAYSANYNQYDLYYDNTSYPGNPLAKPPIPPYSALIEVDVCRTCVGYDNKYRNQDGSMASNVDIDTKHWYMLTLRNKVAKTPAKPGTNNINNHVVDVFWNGFPLYGSRQTNNVSAQGLRCNAKLILGAMRFSSGMNSGEGYLSCFLKGRMDEFIVYKRALKDDEIRGHFIMGQEH
jgi:hypothetical protein